MKKKIMLVDDSSTNNILYSSILTDEGYEVVVCENAKDALKAVIKEQPSLIILDLMMPGMDGFNFLESLKNEPEVSSTPVIMLTANGSDENEEKAMAYGVKAFLVKPVGIKEITEAVNNTILYSS